MSKVSRSQYQKVVEENKRLLADIKTMTSDGISSEKILLIQKWRDKFKRAEDLNQKLKNVFQGFE